MNRILGRYNTIFRGSFIPSYPSILKDGNTVAWYDSQLLSTITKDGSNLVSQWNDRLASGHDLIQATGADQPLWSANGILFDAVSEFMKTAGFTFNQPEFIYIVIKQVTWTHLNRFFDGNVTSSGMMRQFTLTPNITAYAGAESAGNNDLAVNTFGIIRCLFNGVSGKLIVNENTPITGDFGALDMSGFTLGSNGLGNGNWSNIQVKEVILRKVADGTTDEQNIYNYLKNKYGI